MTTRALLRDSERELTAHIAGYAWIARRELRFSVNGETLVVNVGERIPDAAWAACTSVQRARLRDPSNRMTAPA